MPGNGSSLVRCKPTAAGLASLEASKRLGELFRLMDRLEACERWERDHPGQEQLQHEEAIEALVERAGRVYYECYKNGWVENYG